VSNHVNRRTVFQQIFWTKERVTNRDIWAWLFPGKAYNLTIVIFSGEATTDIRQDDKLTRLVVLIVPITVTASVLKLWLPDTVSWGTSSFVWSILIYWFPSKPPIQFSRWVLLCLLIAIASSLGALVL
jgi:hypothetical protein